MGTGETIRPGDVQRMSAGTGIQHSEFNGSKKDEVHFLQIWLIPTTQGIKPGYEQKLFTEADKRGKLELVASPNGQDGSITVHTDAKLYAGLFTEGESAELAIGPGRGAWLHVAKGTVRINGKELSAGDAASFENESTVRIEGVAEGEVLAFDLA